MVRSLRAISFEGEMVMKLDITAIRPAEIPFAFDQDGQLDSRSGCIGHLQGDFGSGREFYPEWVDHQAQFKTHDFGVELNKVVHALQAKGGCGLLADRHRMAEFCARHPETALGTGYAAVYGVKLKTASRTYLLRCDPRKGETNFCLYAYETPLLEHCVEQLVRQRPVPAGTRFREEAR